jgi:hypothetical protein
MRYSGSVVGVSLSAMVPCLAVLKSIPMSHGPRANVIQPLRTLLSGRGTPPRQHSATSPLRSLKHLGNYMPVGRRVKIGSDTRALSVFSGIASLPFAEGKPARLIPRSRMIGTCSEVWVIYCTSRQAYNISVIMAPLQALRMGMGQNCPTPRHYGFIRAHRRNGQCDL